MGKRIREWSSGDNEVSYLWLQDFYYIMEMGDLEKIVEVLEKALIGKEFTITRNASLWDEFAETTREIDILISGNIGTHSLKIAIECRDRSRLQDLTWIEQLATKKKNLKINKVIALSSKGFSTPAMKLAESEGIEIRSVNPTEVLSSLQDIKLVCCDCGFKLTSAKVTFLKNSSNAEVPPTIQQREKIFVDMGTGDRYSMFDLVTNVTSSNHFELYRSLKSNDNPVQKTVIINIDDEQHLGIMSNGVFHRIKTVTVEGVFHVKMYHAIAVDYAQYMSKADTLADFGQYTFDTEGGNQLTGFIIKQPMKDDLHISIDFPKRKEKA
jgi:hypothetical protein